MVDPGAFTEAGPLGILALTAFCLWMAAREAVKYRRIDCDDARAQAAEERRLRLDSEARFREDNHDLQTEVTKLRDQLFETSRTEHDKRVAVARENAMLRTVLAELGVSPPSEGTEG